MVEKESSVRKIGIDFGTTNSAAATYLQQDIRETLAGGVDPIPSIIAYNQGDYFYGQEALEKMRDKDDQSLIITGIKTMLGRSPTHRVESESFDPVELATGFLRFLLLELFGGEEPPENLEAVIGTPVEFLPSHREALARAAKDAGIARAEFVYEPTAAVHAALSRLKEVPQGPIAVIDWGGGTVDITIVRFNLEPHEGIEDLNVNARKDGLGGGDMDKYICREAISGSAEAQEWFDRQDRSVQSQIYGLIEHGKIYYLENGKLGPFADFSHPSIDPPELQEHFQLTPELIESCVRKYSEKVRRLALRTTTAAGLGVEDVDHVLLIGGPCKSARVRRHLNDIWPNAKELSVKHRQRATVRGCTMLADTGFDLRLGADIAVRQSDDRFHKVLKRYKKFDRAEGELLSRRAMYRVTDFTAQQAVFDIGYIPAGGEGEYQGLEIIQVPVMHKRFYETNTIQPYDVILEIGLDELLYVSVTATGRIQPEGGAGFVDIKEMVKLSKIPMILVPRKEGQDV